MKSTLNSRLITAAGLALSAAGAYGQTKMTANVPFAFNTAGGNQPAGRYAVVPATGHGSVMKLENRETGRSTMIGVGTPSAEKQHSARLVLVCGSESGCVLTRVVVDDGRAWSY